MDSFRKCGPLVGSVSAPFSWSEARLFDKSDGGTSQRVYSFLDCSKVILSIQLVLAHPYEEIDIDTESINSEYPEHLDPSDVQLLVGLCLTYADGSTMSAGISEAETAISEDDDRPCICVRGEGLVYFPNDWSMDEKQPRWRSKSEWPQDPHYSVKAWHTKGSHLSSLEV